MKKHNSGITLVSLVITIIVLIILASITVYSGVSTVRSARLTKFTAELKIMQQKVNELYDSYTNNKSVTVNGTEYVGAGQTATETEEAIQGIQEIGTDPEGIFNATRLDEIFSEEGSGITDRTGYMYYDTSTLQSLGLEDMEYEFFVNVASRSVVSIEGFNDAGNIYYTLNQVPDGVYNVEYNGISNDVTFNTISEVKDGQGKIYVTNISSQEYVNKWQVQYRLKGEKNWYTTEEFTGSEYTIEVPIKNWLDVYEIQVIHGDEISSQKEACVLQVGSYVTNYTYDKAENYMLTVEETGSESNLTEGIPQENLKWKILNIHDDGTIDLISDTATDKEIYFKGALGYNNAVYVLNDICAKQYSNLNLDITARSLNIEDVEALFNETALEDRNNYIAENKVLQYGKSKLYVGTYPKLYSRENGSWTDITQDVSQLTQEEIENNVKTNGLKPSENGYTELTAETADEELKNIAITQTYYSLETKEEYFNNNIYSVLFGNNENYWLASRCVVAYAEYAGFGICGINDNLIGGSGVFNSQKGEGEPSRKIRPVITLKTDNYKLVSVEGENGTDIEYEIVVE